MHVLSWTVLRYLENKYSGTRKDLADRLRTRFDEDVDYVGPDGKTRYRCHADKYEDVASGRPLAVLSADFKAHPLNALLCDLAELCRDHYTTVGHLVPSTSSATPSVDATSQVDYSKGRIFPKSRLGLPAPMPATSSVRVPSLQTGVPTHPHQASTPGAQTSNTTTSPLANYQKFMEKFEAAFEKSGWVDIPRQRTPMGKKLGPSISPASGTHVGSKRSAGTSAGSHSRKRRHKTTKNTSETLPTSSYKKSSSLSFYASTMDEDEEGDV